MPKNLNNLKPKKILIADDDPSILDVVKIMLEMAGYEVNLSVDGGAISKMKDHLPDLLLLDIWMSGLDGREICKKLKSQKETKKIPIIIISANKDTEKIAKDSGADDFIEKPFEMDYLLAKVKKHLK